MAALTDDSPFFSTVLLKNWPFSLGFWRLSRKKGSLARMGELPLELSFGGVQHAAYQFIWQGFLGRRNMQLLIWLARLSWAEAKILTHNRRPFDLF